MDIHMDKEKKWNALREGQQETEAAVSAAKKKRSWARIRTGLYTAIAVMLVMSAAMGTAWAYFTTYASAKGGAVLKLGHHEEVDEDFNSWEKVIDISAKDYSNPVYLRARAYSAEYPVSYSNSQNWKLVGDWMYYTKTLDPGKSLSDAGDELKVQINDVPKSGDTGLQDGDSFNVIVIYESTEIQYDESGNPLAPEEADWTRKVDTNRTNTTLGGDE